MNNIHDILQNTFGFKTFRGKQEEIIQSLVDGQDALVIMPTGGGKSLCFQIPALVREGLAIVISPLIALMNDQVAALKQLDIPAATIHSNIDPDLIEEIYQQIEQQKLQLLYVSPEKVLSNGFLPFIKKQKISLFAIDEAHCVSIWGNDFRPEYVKLSILKKDFPEIPTIALTATADEATRNDILKQLRLNTHHPFISSFERPNIHLEAKPGVQRFEQIIRFLDSHADQAGIIYCLSRKSTENLASRIGSYGYKARAYHAGMEGSDRRKVQAAFQNDTLQIVCATIAFGMGIDKPNIRWIIHYNMPRNIEGYYQEIGRAGRDGDPAKALLFYGWGDFILLKRFIDESEADEQFKTVQRAKLDRMWQFASAMSCRTNMILNYFGEYKNGPCAHCDNCASPPELFDGTNYAQMALSAIIRSKQQVGLNLLIDILRGSYKQEIRHQNYHRLKTFGVGSEVPYTHWRHYITQMINQGTISIDFTDYSRLKTTPLSESILRNKTTLQLAKYISFEARKPKPLIKPEIDLSEMDHSLLEKLKSWRWANAQKQHVPAYIILNNKTLEQIASLKPDTGARLLSVDGIGQAKLEKYGKEILEIIKNQS